MESGNNLWLLRNDSSAIEGVKIQSGGIEIIVPPLSIGWVRSNKDIIKRITKNQYEDATDRIDDIITIMHAALRYNYPAVTADEVANKINMQTMEKVVEAAMGEVADNKKRVGESSPEA
jgi:hypothetical protein